MKKLIDILQQLFGAAIVVLMVYFVLIKTGIIWLLIIAIPLLLYFCSKTSIKTNESCYKCGNRFSSHNERHKTTGYCFECLSSHENLLMAAFESERKHRQHAGKDRRLYDIYLNSGKWQLIRKQKIEASGSKCTNCGSIKNLEVHHKTYDRLGNEELSDLSVLCRECHHLAHTSRAKVKLDDFDVDDYINSLLYENKPKNLDTEETITGK